MKQKKELSKETKELNAIVIIFIILMLGVIGSIFFTYKFMAGYHAMDLSQNMRWLEAEYGLELLDQASDYQYYTSEHMFITGIKYMFDSFFAMAISCFFIGYAFVIAIMKSYKNAKGNKR